MPGLYIHIPFCQKKCIYCNFYSIESTDGKQEFLQLLGREIGLRAAALAGDPSAPREYDTVFFGGGTPSLLTMEELGAIMTSLRSGFRIADGTEITVECNPGTLAPERLEGYKALGVNRISFGVQSFSDEELRFLSRIHTADEARRGVAQARAVFENVSLDLIFALPGQSLERWRANLNEGIALGTSHISAYSLIFEEGTPLNAMRLRGEVLPATDTLDADMYEETMRTLAGHGLRQYEVSNYARAGYECRHNLGYWERGTYISFGPSAHSLLRGADGVPDIRWANVSGLTAYNEMLSAGRLPVASREMLSSQVVLEETIMLGLRSRGIILDEFRRVAGAELAEVAPEELRGLLDGGYACYDSGRLRLSERGYPFADRFALQIVLAAESALPDLQKSDGAYRTAGPGQLVEINL